MITLTKNGNAIVFTFSDNAHYLFDGTIEVPVNSLTLITDNSQMATFKKSASNDIFISATYAELGMSKSELESWFKENACGSTGGGGVTSGEVETMIDQAISGKQDTLIAGSGITISGNVISSEGGNKVVELTQAQYDALVDKDPDTFYIITDAEAIDINNYYTKTAVDTALAAKANTATTYTKTEVDTALANKADTSAVTEAISSAVSGKADTSSVYTKSEVDTALSGKQDTLIAGDNITISGNVISADGGGKAVSGGTNISITTGETSDTINCTLNLENGTNSQSGGIKQKSNAGTNYVSGRDACAFGCGNQAGGTNSFVTGVYNIGSIGGDFVSGYKNKTTNSNETLFGMCALSNGSQTSEMNGNSGCTLFAVGNGEWRSQTKHNAIDIRQNGDIYIADTNDTSTSNYYEKPMIKLQDALGGGGGVSESAFTSYSAATDARISEDEEVTAAGLNALNDALGGLKLVKLTQAEYDALATKDANTLYIISNVVS